MKKNTTTTTPATPALISPQSYLQDLKARVQIHNTEFVQLVKDVYQWGVEAHNLVDQAVDTVKPTVQPLLARIKN